MDISVTSFRARCLDLIRRVEQGGKPVTIRRRGRVVARLEPAGDSAPSTRPWEQLRALGGQARFAADESSLQHGDFQASR
jgi:prevent-host-death family protein